jgi:hypothetical protein
MAGNLTSTSRNWCRGWKFAAGVFCILAGIAAVSGAVAFIRSKSNSLDHNAIAVDDAIKAFYQSNASLWMANSTAVLNSKIPIPLITVPLRVDGLTRPVEFASPVFQVSVPSYLQSRDLAVDVEIHSFIDAAAPTVPASVTPPKAARIEIEPIDTFRKIKTVEVRCSSRSGCTAEDMFKTCEAATCAGAVVDKGPGATNFGNLVTCRYLVHARTICRVMEQSTAGWVPSTDKVYCDWPFTDPRLRCGNSSSTQPPLLQIRVKTDPYIAVSAATKGSLTFRRDDSSAIAIVPVVILIAIGLIAVGIRTIWRWNVRRRLRLRCDASANEAVSATDLSAVEMPSQVVTPASDEEEPPNV